VRRNIGIWKQKAYGTFEWISDRTAANINAAKFYPYNEGIDIRSGLSISHVRLQRVYSY
jgi:hypothetical protein